MQKIWISTGASRKETNWKNIELKWEALVEKLKKTKRTDETYAQYCRMSKDDQGATKDVGGFVGGIVTGGRRIKGSVTTRYLLTLDVDFSDKHFAEDVEMVLGYEAVIYSTHKHSKENPRYRLILPMSREVLPDEYEAVARRIAGDLNIELFDPTTFQTERLMYWPSTSKDGDYEYHHQVGPWVDPDEVLGRYADWKDHSQWPYSAKVSRKVLDDIAKQEDPALKGGLVGVFCRIYSIEDVIEKYLSEVYEPTEQGDRWTYREGSTSGGLVVYDGKWAYSHHSTDPTSGRLCNAFDFVRIHLFGESDDRVEAGTPSVKKPSYNKMIELITGDDQVKMHMVSERIEDKTKLMNKVLGNGEIVDKDGKASLDWAKALDVDKKGNVLNTISNVVLILENDEKLKGCLCYDDLAKVAMVKKDLPWRKVTRYSRQLVDADDAEFRNYFEIMYGITYRDKIKDGLEIVIHKNTFHPVKEYLKGLQWDGEERLDRLLIEYLGAEDTRYVREVTRKTLVAAVARVFQPGIKFDHVLVLVGPQGLGKSRLIGRLGMEWYSDTFGSLQNKDAMEQIQGVWIMEIGELAGLKKQEVETIKLFISKQEDRFRVAYGRRVETYARQCVFIGTTNNSEFLQDATGNRRFWPVQCGVDGRTRTEMISREIVDQIWAESCHWYTMGEDLFLTTEVETLAKSVQEHYTEKDDLTGPITDYLEMRVPANWYDLSIYDKRSFLSGDDSIGQAESVRDWITVPEIWTELIGGTLKDMTKHNTQNIRKIMNRMSGWESKLINKKPWGTQRGWVKVSVEDAKTAKQQQQH